MARQIGWTMSSQAAANHQLLGEAVSWLRSRLLAYQDPKSPGRRPSHLCPGPARVKPAVGAVPFRAKNLAALRRGRVCPGSGRVVCPGTGPSQLRLPHLALALSLFDDASWGCALAGTPAALLAAGPIHHAPDRTLTVSPLQADERIVNYLKGLNELDHRLLPFLLPLPTDEHR